ncbi:hypothetical protein DMN91_002301 [Ooceraea biroi]|uniref:Uncharacterized protein n=1 Tax=Ooceraea biroi TaxID=2015173 RepID=A0A3L8DZT3_OOCBI|nr:hypothetical protein DMN91_001595 [Ooceraea biroi]RLU26135.1 hypothetical protein DMN91_002301 [Ooceraea biroi]
MDTKRMSIGYPVLSGRGKASIGFHEFKVIPSVTSTTIQPEDQMEASTSRYSPHFDGGIWLQCLIGCYKKMRMSTPGILPPWLRPHALRGKPCQLYQQSPPPGTQDPNSPPP